MLVMRSIDEKTEAEPAEKRAKLEDNREDSASGEVGVMEVATVDNEAREAKKIETGNLPTKPGENVEEGGAS